MIELGKTVPDGSPRVQSQSSPFQRCNMSEDDDEDYLDDEEDEEEIDDDDE